jgi:23S rRNA pseudouridine1911/1915/1917 synthase
VEYLARRYTHSSATQWRERIEAGSVTVDGRAVPPSTLVRAGQDIAWHRPPWEEPEAPTAFAVLYRDPHLLAVAKPAGLPTLPGAGFQENTLLTRVRAGFPGASPAHRLGRWTSGLVLFGLTPEARAGLALAWRDGRVNKEYRALASGAPRWRDLAIETPIGPVPHAGLGEIHAASPRGKPSRSRAEVLEIRDRSFLARVTIATGRPHQIRIHLAAVGHPLVGDPLYGPGGIPAPNALPGDGGYSLHARALRFAHPVTGAEVAVECGCPPPLRRTAPGS